MNKIILIKKNERMSKHQKLLILKFLHEHNIKIHEHSDGTRVNLDLLNEEIFTALVEYVEKIDIPIDPVHQI